jgi:hypothetical protein
MLGAGLLKEQSSSTHRDGLNSVELGPFPTRGERHLPQSQSINSRTQNLSPPAVALPPPAPPVPFERHQLEIHHCPPPPQP